MKIRKERKKVKKVVIVVIIAVFFALSSLFVLKSFGIFTLESSQKKEDRLENTVDYKEPVDDQKEESDRIKNAFDKEHYGNDKGVAKPVEGEDSVGVNITYISQEGSMILIRAAIQSAVPGKCKLSIFQKESLIDTYSEDTLTQGGYSVCKGFDIDATSLGYGNTTFKVSYDNNSATGFAQKDFKIN